MRSWKLKPMVQNSQLDNIQGLFTKQVYDYYRLCSEHFETSMCMNSDKQRTRVEYFAYCIQRA